MNEILGNPCRWDKEEFFNLNIIDKIQKIFPYTFQLFAEKFKIKIENLPNLKIVEENWTEWGELSLKMMSDPKCQDECMNFFKHGKLVEFNDGDIDQTYYMGKITNKKLTSIRDLKKLFSRHGGSGKYSPSRAYNSNINKIYNNDVITLPPPFIITYPIPVRNHKHILMGGHKRSTVALQMNIKPIKVWNIIIK